MFQLEFFRYLSVYLDFCQELDDYSKLRSELVQRDTKGDIGLGLIVERYMMSGLYCLFTMNFFINYSMNYRYYFYGIRYRPEFELYISEKLFGVVLENVVKKNANTGRIAWGIRF